jgi:hypothetical protein
MTSYLLGLDLGQAQDYTAFVIAELRNEPTGEFHTDGTEKTTKHYDVRHLERFPLGASYPKIVAAVVDRAAALPWPGYSDITPQLVVDGTGVGRPIIDLLRAAQPRAAIVPCTISGGNAAVHDATTGYWNVPKRDLASTLAVLLQSARLHVAPALPDAAVLMQELLNFKVKITAAAHDTYGAWREGQHDDLVLAAALAVWWSERPRQWTWEIR